MAQRLFVAVRPPERVLDVVAGLARPGVTGLRWTAREQWHVTLRFLGAVEEATPVVEALRWVADGRPGGSGPAPEAELGPAVRRFGNRVLHLPVTGLDGLASRVLEATADMGRPAEDREFSGHVTLARVAKRTRVDLRQLAGEALPGPAEWRRWTVRDVCLVESRLAPTGARYEVVERFPLASSA
ncbi:MAG TPA: RNA 2',3'-cyclic phosphodiesterase [Acidimicrobiales bacterium]|nr:RNA 2',3'-cyclic phosphodiesterase [Acidimicrobiales bacterium]